MNKSIALAEAIRQQEATATELKRRYSKAVADMVASPGDAQLHAIMAGEMAGLSTELAGVSAGLQALRHAHDEILIAEAAEQADRLKADAKKRIGGFVKKFGQRGESYARLQGAADAFLEALRDHCEGGSSLRPDAADIARGLWGPRADDHAVTVADAATGVTKTDAAAVATVLREAMQIFGAHRLDTYVAINDFAQPVSFAQAHEQNVRIVEKLDTA